MFDKISLDPGTLLGGLSSLIIGMFGFAFHTHERRLDSLETYGSPAHREQIAALVVEVREARKQLDRIEQKVDDYSGHDRSSPLA